jgi:hypothetical protein
VFTNYRADGALGQARIRQFEDGSGGGVYVSSFHPAAFQAGRSDSLVEAHGATGVLLLVFTSGVGYARFNIFTVDGSCQP